MLQQTTVRVAEAYFARFMRRFPDVASLARASEADVLALWSGLGYYQRARNLRRTAQAIVRDHGGAVPRDEAAMRGLPGVGRYTAGAVLSIAYDLPLPALDGNVARVLSRVFAIGGSPREGVVARRLWRIAGQLAPRRGAGELNQALMELGALVCSPTNPRCDACPLARLCVASAAGASARIPETRRRPAPLSVRHASVLATRGRRVLLERRADGPLLGGMWELPTVALASGDRVPAALEAGLAGRGLPRVRIGEQIAEVRHSITYRRITVAVFAAEALRAPAVRTVRFRWLDPRAEIALTGVARKSLRAAGLLGD